MNNKVISGISTFLAAAALVLSITLIFCLGNAERAQAGTYEGSVFISLSEDGTFVVSDGEIADTVMAHLEIPLQDVADIQLKDWDLEKYSYTDYFTDEPDPDAPTVLKLFLYILEHYYGSAGSGVPLAYSGSPHHFFMETFWGHDCNLMYYVNGTYPLYYEGWGACADGILLSDGDFVDIAMYTHWGFYTEPNAGFNYFAGSNSDPEDGEITFSYEVETGEPLTLQVIRGFGNIDVGEATSFSMADELPVFCGTEVDLNAMTDLFLEDGKAEITFQKPGTYYVWTEGGAGENSGDPCSCPAVARVTVTGEPVNTLPVLKEGTDPEINRSINTKEKYKLYLPDIFIDEDGDELTYKVSIDGGDWQDIDAAYSFAPGIDGEYVLRFRANDGKDDSEDEYKVMLTASAEIPVSDDHEHELSKIGKVDATCEHDGHEEYWECSVCGKLFADEEAFREIGSPEVISGGHDWENPTYEWNEDDTKVTATRVCKNDESHVETETVGVASKEIVMQPHCMRQGRATLTSEAFDNEVFKVQKKNVDTPLEPDWHDYGEWEETKAPTCTEKGTEERVCSRNKSHKEERDIEPLGHDWEDDFTVDKEATCTEEGSKSVHCTRCEATKYATEIPVIAHALKAHEGITPKCEEKGAAQYWECIECGKYFSEPAGLNEIKEGSWVIPEAGHSEGAMVTENVTLHKCTEAGSHEEVTYCDVCGTEIERKTVIDAALGHDLEEDFTVDKEATCTEEGSKSVHCTRCGETKHKTAIPKKAHTLEGHDGVSPTCEEEGAAPYWECTECGKYFSEPVGFMEIEEGSWVLTAAGHLEGAMVTENVTLPKCTEEGSHEEVTYCDVCGTEIERKTVIDAALGHDWGEWEVTKQASDSEAGEEQRVCANDPSHVETRVIPKKEEAPENDGSTKPASGDTKEGTRPSDEKKDETKPSPDEKKEDTTPSDSKEASPAANDPGSKTPSDENLKKAVVDKKLAIKTSTVSTTAKTRKKQMIVKWKKVKNATNYKIAYRKAGAKKWTEKWTNGRNKYTLTKMKKNGLYEFKLMAVAKSGSTWTKSKWSKVNYRFYAKVKQKVKAGKGSVTVNVKKFKKASGYEVLTGTVNKAAKMKVKTFKGSKKTKLVMKGQKAGKKAFVRSRPYKTYKGHKYIGILNGAKQVRVK